MQNEDVYIVLSIFKAMRENMINDFINHEIEIFSPSFKYEKSPVSLDIAMDKYFISWLNNHYNYFTTVLNQNNYDFDKSSALNKIFIEMYLKLATSFNHVKSNIESSEVTREILSQKVTALKELLNVADLTDVKFNRLKYENDRNKVLFDRKIKELEQEEK